MHNKYNQNGNFEARLTNQKIVNVNTQVQALSLLQISICCTI